MRLLVLEILVILLLFPFGFSFFLFVLLLGFHSISSPSPLDFYYIVFLDDCNFPVSGILVFCLDFY